MDKYKIIKHLGEGSYGTANLVETETGEQVVVKRINYDPNSYQYRDVNDEARALKKLCNCLELKDKECLEHLPCFIETFSEKISDDTINLYIVQSYVPGVNYEQFVEEIGYSFRNKPKDLTILLLMSMLKLAKSIKYIHDRGITHNDLRDENIIIRPSINKNKIEDVVLIDFGLANLQDNPDFKAEDINRLGARFIHTYRVLNQPFDWNKYMPISFGNKEFEELVYAMRNSNSKSRPSIDVVIDKLQKILEDVIATGKGIMYKF